ncbi:hypothetical protein Syun_023291 [Stephania yunnanensis]|uniref:Uncharacterized protein n=1 Tax=Stephania yunnanensis TaxID=152371 RepID=A0AAP0I3D7_9MAGN
MREKREMEGESERSGRKGATTTPSSSRRRRPARRRRWRTADAVADRQRWRGATERQGSRQWWPMAELRDDGRPASSGGAARRRGSRRRRMARSEQPSSGCARLDDAVHRQRATHRGARGRRRKASKPAAA